MPRDRPCQRGQWEKKESSARLQRRRSEGGGGDEQGGPAEAEEAQSIVGEELRQFEEWRDSLETVPTIKGLRSYAERIRLAELEKCLQKIGDEELRNKLKKTLDEMSSGIVNKLLHGPLQHLRCDGGESQDLDEMLEKMHVLNRMFSLGTEKAKVVEQKIKSKVQKAQR